MFSQKPATYIETDKIEARGYKWMVDIDLAKISQATDLLLNAEKPIILAGGGVITSNASDELVQMSDLLMAPVATTFMGKGSFPENHPLSLGNIGMHGNPAANRILCEADVLLAIGTRFSDRATANIDSFASNAKKIHIDIDEAEIGKNIEVDVPIIADAKAALKILLNALDSKINKKERNAWESE